MQQQVIAGPHDDSQDPQSSHDLPFFQRRCITAGDRFRGRHLQHCHRSKNLPQEYVYLFTFFPHFETNAHDTKWTFLLLTPFFSFAFHRQQLCHVGPCPPVLVLGSHDPSLPKCPAVKKLGHNTEQQSTPNKIACAHHVCLRHNPEEYSRPGRGLVLCPDVSKGSVGKKVYLIIAMIQGHE